MVSAAQVERCRNVHDRKAAAGVSRARGTQRGQRVAAHQGGLLAELFERIILYALAVKRIDDGHASPPMNARLYRTFHQFWRLASLLGSDGHHMARMLPNHEKTF